MKCPHCGKEIPEEPEEAGGIEVSIEGDPESVRALLSSALTEKEEPGEKE